MKLKNLSVRKQLIFVFLIILAFVLVLGSVSLYQSKRLSDQVNLIYDHPLVVRNAFYELEIAALDSGVEIRNLADEDNLLMIDPILTNIQIDYTNIERNIEIISENYLGDSEDVTNLELTYQQWRTYRDYTIYLIQEGNYIDAKARLAVDGVGEQNRIAFFSAIDVIDLYSSQKAIEIFNASNTLSTLLAFQLVILILAIIILEFVIYWVLMSQMTRPLNELSRLALNVSKGDFSVRTHFSSKNEFGTLCDSMNVMIEKIDKQIKLQDNHRFLADALLQANTPEYFFNSALYELCLITSSEAGIFYAIEEGTNLLVKKSSFGTSSPLKDEISIEDVDKEYGLSIFSKEPKILNSLSKDAKLVISTTYAEYLPNEIYSIPIFSNQRLIALITLGTTKSYSEDHQLFINSIIDSIKSRVEAAIANLKIRLILGELEEQNRELEVQQTELDSMNQELVQQNITLELQKKQLSDASLHKTNFLSTMSHELRTPLNSVIALSGVLKRQLLTKISEEEHQYLEVIERNGKNLLSLINDILDISRIESGKVELYVKPFSPCSVINELVLSIKEIAKSKGLDILTDCLSKDILIESDQDKFTHIIQNILSNAVKFTEKGFIQISVKEEKDHISIAIKDTGIGIEKENLASIFDEFKQADASTSRKYGGTGLGLSIAKKYTALLQGNLNVSSVFEKGSTFTLTIPKKIKGEDVSNQHDYPIKIGNMAYIDHGVHETRKILVIDDNESIRIQLNELLTKENYQVFTANDVDEALIEIEKNQPDLILLDIILPKMDGFELLKNIRTIEKSKHIPVFVLTAKEITKKELKELKQNNVHQYIQKGEITSPDLLQAIYQTLFPAQESLSIDIKDSFIDKPLILIVEDNPDNMITAVAILKDKFNLVQAVDGLDGVIQAKKHRPDLILMDIALPKMDGIQAFHEIQKIPRLKNIPVIALTASAMTQDKKSILGYGFTAFISKPINETTFIKTIEEVLYGA